MYKRILVPLDKSEMSQRSLPYAVLLAESLGSKLELLYVVPWPGHIRSKPVLEVAPWTDIEQAATRAAHEYLNTVAAPYQKRGLDPTTVVLVGNPIEEIQGEAKAEPEGLVVMTTHSTSGFGKWSLGSVTGKVVQSAASPTLVIRSTEGPAPEGPQISKIILPLDGTKASEAAMPHAVALAKALKAEIVILKSVGANAYGYHDFSEIAPETYSRLSQVIQRETDTYLDNVEERLKAQGMDRISRSTPFEKADSAIVSASSNGTSSLVVMTSYIRRSPDGITFGSVTDRVVRHSESPVLVVPPHKAELEPSS